MMLRRLAYGGESYTDRGESPDAGLLWERFESVWASFMASEALGQKRRAALDALTETCHETSADDWDGYGAKAVSTLTQYQAHRLLRILPPGFPLPDVGADPDGELSFEWYREPRRVFSVSIAGNGRLSYAGIFGQRSVHGTEYLGDELPEAVVANLKRLLF